MITLIKNLLAITLALCFLVNSAAAHGGWGGSFPSVTLQSESKILNEQALTMAVANFRWRRLSRAPILLCLMLSSSPLFLPIARAQTQAPSRIQTSKEDEDIDFTLSQLRTLAHIYSETYDAEHQMAVPMPPGQTPGYDDHAAWFNRTRSRIINSEQQAKSEIIQLLIGLLPKMPPANIKKWFKENGLRLPADAIGAAQEQLKRQNHIKPKDPATAPKDTAMLLRVSA